jgi:hypothetical protein
VTILIMFITWKNRAFYDKEPLSVMMEAALIGCLGAVPVLMIACATAAVLRFLAQRLLAG